MSLFGRLIPRVAPFSRGLNSSLAKVTARAQNSGGSPLSLVAIAAGAFSTTAFTVAHSVALSPQSAERHAVSDAIDGSPQYALWKNSVKGSDTATVRRVVAAGGEINTYDKHGKQAIHWAAERGDSAMLRTLVELGFSPIDSLTQTTVTPARQPDTLLCFGETAMHKAAGRGKTQAMRTLMTLGLSAEKLNCQDSEGYTALHKAARRGHVDAVQVLIELGFSNMDAQDKSGMTALHRTVDQASKGSTQVLQMLVKTGRVSLETKDSNGNTALSLAEARGMNEAVQLLKAAGAK